MMDSLLDTLQVAFIGGGNMASALIEGMLAQGLPTTHVTIVEPYLPQREKHTARGWQALAECTDELLKADVIVLAVKPQQLHAALQTLQPFVREQLIVSVAAGIRLADIARWLGGYDKLIRTMPNTPALVGAGITGMYALPAVTTTEKERAAAMLNAVGEVVWVEDENQIDAITALSGSGPAYVFYFIEAMQQAAAELGLSEAAGRSLAIGTFVGAAKLAAMSDEPASTLREKVTSKGGTTFAALTHMQSQQVKEHIVAAIHAANHRAGELGDELGKD